MRKLLASVLCILSIPLAAHAQEKTSIDRLDPTLDDIIAPGTKLEELADTSGLGTRESGVWVRKGGYLLYCARNVGPNAGSGQAENANLIKWDPRDGKATVFLANSECCGVTADRQGRILFETNFGEGRIVRIEKNGRRTALARGKPLNAPNDLAYKSDGSIYFTDLGRVPRDAHPDDVRGVYLLKHGKIKILSPTPAAEISNPNGLAFSPDEKFLYLTDNPKVMKFEVLEDGTIANGRVFVDMNDGVPLRAFFPDGIKVDQRGNVYCTGPGGVWILSPEGKHIGTILEPNRPADLVFGGPDGKALFILSRPGLRRVNLKVSGIVP